MNNEKWGDGNRLQDTIKFKATEVHELKAPINPTKMLSELEVKKLWLCFWNSEPLPRKGHDLMGVGGGVECRPPIPF